MMGFVRQRLAQARSGTRVVTYHGFGAEPPEGYVLKADEACGSDRLQLWVKAYSVQRRPGTDRGRFDPAIQ